jgi:ribonuclease-3
LLGHTFRDPHLLELALTHRSFAFENASSSASSADANNDPQKDNEQLEFLGDAVLGMIAAESLIRHFPQSREGELSRLRASVVSRKYLGKVGTRLELGRWLRLGKTTTDSGGEHNAALLANTVEALIAALYLDGGQEAARRFVEREVLAAALPDLETSIAAGSSFSGAVGDFKSGLQELLQADGLSTPEYRVLEESGPAHRRLFRIQVAVAGEPLAEAQASSKKEAQQEAARLATEQLRQRAAAVADSPTASPKPAGRSRG